ncbi:3'-5' exonuclease [Alloalcanivorax xenomutans]|uniref:3'-5' exonuclease n=1 Tax=Alloalcanivorax xenomutans TaxID=1094342 RepID=UPI001F35188C|nr:3'-5' exonuclease [Alloalcanivorax xenomutans]MCE7525505.1 3'-5' exonuclease [Alloalcanivorax xenomutans]
MNVLVFDIETIPDLEGGRRLYDLEGLNDKDTASALFNLRRQENGTEFLRLHLHRIVAISVVLRSAQGIKVWSLGDEDSSEKELIERFYDGIERFTPQLVSWNGGGFDLPVLNYRALKHGVVARRFWETGGEDTSFRFNNYISRYHQRHLDVMDQLAMFNGRAVAPLDQIASLLGFPGKMGMSGAKVFDAFQEGDIKGIRDYCETDVLNTWLVFLRFQLMRGEIDATGYEQELTLLRDYLRQEGHPHFLAFLETWESVDG